MAVSCIYTGVDNPGFVLSQHLSCLSLAVSDTHQCKTTFAVHNCAHYFNQFCELDGNICGSVASSYTVINLIA